MRYTFQPNIGTRPSVIFRALLSAVCSVPGVIPVRAFLIGRLNQVDNMGERGLTDVKDPVYSTQSGECEVRVYRDLDRGEYVVIRNTVQGELAVFSFDGSQRGSMSRERANKMAEEYATAYVRGYNDAMEDK